MPRRAAAVAAVVIVSTIGSAAPPAPGAKPRVQRLAFFGFAASNSFAQATWSGIRATAAKRHVAARFFDSGFSASRQVAEIQDATTSGQYQAFIVQANDGNAVVPAIKEAIKAGIVVVGESAPIGPRYDTIEPQVPGLIFVGEATTRNGATLGRLGIQACGSLDPCQVAYLEGFRSLPLDTARTNAVKATLATSPRVRLVASVEGGYTAAEGLTAAQNVLQAHPGINVIIGSSQALEGAQQAVQQVGKLGKIKLVGNGGSCQAIAAVRSGAWFATYVFAERSDGAKAAEFAIDAAMGRKVPHSFNTARVRNPIGTKNTLGNFKAQYCD
jgi:ribose transport system substrate-binding protein